MLENKIFTISSSEEFAALALEIFQLQYDKVKIYRDFCDLLRTTPASVKTIQDIPFLPIDFFKQQRVISSEKISENLCRPPSLVAARRHSPSDSSSRPAGSPKCAPRGRREALFRVKRKSFSSRTLVRLGHPDPCSRFHQSIQVFTDLRENSPAWHRGCITLKRS